MVELAEAKDHLRITSDDQDNMIQNQIDAAVGHLQSIDVDMTADPLPPALHHAVLMLVAHFFTNAEAVSDVQTFVTPLGVARLIAPYRSISL
ncbi:MAG TPA: phage gp6-like head-tail connector protein [Octadecabacter sp.]|nr:phage gp6-like head-tail connector protein [Octadecabacter sp.]